MDKYPEETYSDPAYAGSCQLNKYRGTWLLAPLFPNKTKIDNILNMNIRSSDIILSSYPKSGTTWLQQIVWKIYCIKHPELKLIEKDNTKNNIEKRFPMLDMYDTDFNEVENRPSPRFLKYHLPYHLLPIAARKNSSVKILYIARDPRDVAVSNYYFMKLLKQLNYVGTPDDMAKAVLSGKDSDGPWLDHVKSFWERKDDENVLFVTYEDLKKNLADGIQRVAKFLEIKLTKDQLDEIVRDTSFESMKTNDTVNYSWMKEDGRSGPEGKFMRKGITGDWKNHISENVADEMKRNLLDPLGECGLVFGDYLNESYSGGETKNEDSSRVQF